MWETICTYPLPSDLFSSAIHPREPLIAVGLASGHVETIRLPSLPSSSSSVVSDASALSNGCGTVDTVWKTRRHKGSCRSVIYSFDGARLFSAGTDGLVKVADTLTGKVESKIAVPHASLSGKPDNPSILHALTPQTLLLATDSAALHIYDLRSISGSSSSRPESTHHPHEDYISSITPLPPSESSTSGMPKQWVSTGGTTLAVTDVRRGVLVKSEDQGEELLSSCFISDLPKKGSSIGSKVLVGGAGGVITLWEKGVWDDQDERIAVDSGKGGGDSLDVIAKVPEAIDRHLVAVGVGDGSIRMVKIGMNKVIAEARHDDLEGVLSLGFEAEGRMISGGGQTVKVWQQALDGDDDEEEEADDATDKKHGSSSDSDESSEDASSDEEPAPRPKKKRKRNRGNSASKANGISFQDLD